ncbi:MAG: exodeoxyribonuclease III [Deltaproteobacteria bacterium]|nr:MAG: exodeoxyribonuclease III [Deltaproteobacteria bacterium]
MKVATWNVNSIRARQAQLLAWLGSFAPDVACLQELKVREEDFPWQAVREAGYHAAVHGQPGYNGVAILSKAPPEDIHMGLEDGQDDVEARLVAARVEGVQVLCVYCPNGGEVGSEKWAYKLEWFARLRAYLERRCDPSDDIVVCGDFNVAPDDRDVKHPERWRESVLCHPEARAAFQRLLDWGLGDTVRKHHPEGGVYSWWDYRLNAFRRDDGLRIDHVLASASLYERCTDAGVDRGPRGQPRPSDHAPVYAVFA